MSEGLAGNQQTPPAEDIRPLIYVVDDQKTVGWVVEGLLSLHNYRVRYFEDPREALEDLKRAEIKPRLLITDYVMSHVNGIELIKLGKQACPQLKTILYSGSVEEEIVMDTTVKPDRFLNKPFQADQLLQMVKNVLAS